MDELLENIKICDEIHTDRLKLEETAALASRLIARRSHSFRVQPSFMNFRKMNVVLCRLKELNIYDDLKEMRKALSTAKAAHRLDKKCHLPSPDNFHYFLQKFQSFTKLLVRAVVCARESHRLFLEIVHRMAFIEIISLFMAVLAEVWTIAIRWCKLAVQFYNSLYPFYANNYKSQLQKNLPKRLDEWLGDEYKEVIDIDPTELNASGPMNDELFLFEQNEAIENEGVVIEQKFEPKLLVMQRVPQSRVNDKLSDHLPKGQKLNVKMFKQQDLMQQRSVSTEIKNRVKEEKPPAKVTVSFGAPPKPPIVSNSSFMDLGEKIERNPKPKSNQTMEKVQPVNVDNLKTITEIRNFISTEDEFRNKEIPRNTSGINNHEWEKFKTATNSLLILSHRGLVIKKFKSLWQKLQLKTKNA